MSRLRLRGVVLLLLIVTACSTTPTPTSQPTPDAAATVTPLPIIEDEAPFYAPAFTLPDIDGQRHALSDYRDQWVLINFWQTTCEPCVAEMPVFQELHERHANLTVLAINIREDVPTIRAFLDEHRLEFPVLRSDDRVTQAYTVMALPQTVLVQPGGEVVYRQFGPVELDHFGAWLMRQMRP